MKRLLALTLVLTLLLCGCGGGQAAQNTEAPATEAPTQPAAETAAPTVQATTAATTEPAPVVYRNPLNGEILDAPFTGRIYANTIGNTQDMLPHVGVNHADILIECFVNNSVVRCLALFSDISSAEAIGATRSTRLMFNQIAQHYDLILSHAGGSSFCLEDIQNRGVENFNIDSLYRQGDPLMKATAYRDETYGRTGDGNLFGVGAGIQAYAESLYPATLERDYGFTFTEDGAPQAGEDAQQVRIRFTYENAKKETLMVYDAEADKYTLNQYGESMVEQITGEPEQFTNVLVVEASITTQSYHSAAYHTADFNAGGTGYFANGGKIIPITWTCDGDKEPLRFFTEDGTPLDLGVGNTYMAICPTDSPVTWGDPAPEITD